MGDFQIAVLDMGLGPNGQCFISARRRLGKKKNDENTPSNGAFFVVEFRQHFGRRSLVKSNLHISNIIVWHSCYKVKKKIEALSAVYGCLLFVISHAILDS